MHEGVGDTGDENLAVAECVNGTGYIEQTYPKGETGSKGGSSFYWQLIDGDQGERESMTLKYDVYFEDGFDFKKRKVENNKISF